MIPNKTLYIKGGRLKLLKYMLNLMGVLVVILFISSCGSGQVFGPTVTPRSTPTPMPVTFDNYPTYRAKSVEIEGVLCLPDDLLCTGSGLNPYTCRLPIFASAACEGASAMLDFKVLSSGQVVPNAMAYIFLRRNVEGRVIFDEQEITLFDQAKQEVKIGSTIRAVGLSSSDEQGSFIHVTILKLLK